MTYYQNVTYIIIHYILFFAFRMLEKTCSSCKNKLVLVLILDSGSGSGGTVSQKPLPGPGPGLTVLPGPTPTGTLQMDFLKTFQVSKHIQDINLQYCFSLYCISHLLYNMPFFKKKMCVLCEYKHNTAFCYRLKLDICDNSLYYPLKHTY